MSCEVAALPFQAHANYGTWSIDFGWVSLLYANIQICYIQLHRIYAKRV